MIRKPTNSLLTKTLKTELVELTAAESETQLNFSQVSVPVVWEDFQPTPSPSARANLHQHPAFRERHALFRRLHCGTRPVSYGCQRKARSDREIL